MNACPSVRPLSSAYASSPAASSKSTSGSARSASPASMDGAPRPSCPRGLLRPSAGTKRMRSTSGLASIARRTSGGTGPSTSSTLNASPPRRERYIHTEPMFTPPAPSVLAMWPSTPGTSRSYRMRALYSPVICTPWPSIMVSRAAPPPTDSPRATISSPFASRTRTSTVLGCDTLVLGSTAMPKRRPRSRAICSESRILRSSVCMPSMPATSARSVPCPRYVRANEPYSVNSASTGGASSSWRAICAMRSAPAV